MAAATPATLASKKPPAFPAPANPSATVAIAPQPAPAAATEPAKPDPAIETVAAPPAPPPAFTVPEPPAEEPAAHFALLSPPAMLTLPPQPPTTSTSPQAPEAVPPATTARNDVPKPAFDTGAHPPSGLGVKPTACSVDSVSFGGDKAVLIRAEDVREIRYIAVAVLDGFETSMAESFIRTHAAGGQSLGAFPSKEAALAKARELCPTP
jgi:hypothetical protein